MNVAAIDMMDLAGGMAGTGRGQEYDGIPHFLGACHALTKRNAGPDCTEGFLRIFNGLDPGIIHRRPYLGGDNGVDPDAVFREVYRPLPGQSVDGPLCCGIARGTSLTCHRQLGGDVDDEPGAFDQGIQREVSEIVEVEEIPLKGSDKVIWSCPEADSVIDPCVVDDSINPAKALERFLDCGAACLDLGQLRFDHQPPLPGCSDALKEGLSGPGTAPYNYRDGLFPGEKLHRCRSDSLGTTGDDDNFVLKFEVHDSVLGGRKLSEGFLLHLDGESRSGRSLVAPVLQNAGSYKVFVQVIDVFGDPAFPGTGDAEVVYH